MESLHDALLKRMGNFGLERALSASLVCEAANRVLPEHARAKVFKEGILTVEVATSAKAYFFKQELETYLEQVNAALARPVVRQLRIRVKR